MGKIVVDSSVVIKWFVAEPLSTEARAVLQGFHDGSLSLHAPDLINAEIGNIVWKKHLLHGLDESDAQAIITAFQSLPLSLTSTADLLEDAYRLAVSRRRSVYDSLYLALAAREQCRFVTADEKLVNALGATMTNVVWVANWS